MRAPRSCAGLARRRRTGPRAGAACSPRAPYASLLYAFRSQSWPVRLGTRTQGNIQQVRELTTVS